VNNCKRDVCSDCCVTSSAFYGIEINDEEVEKCLEECETTFADESESEKES